MSDSFLFQGNLHLKHKYGNLERGNISSEVSIIDNKVSGKKWDEEIGGWRMLMGGSCHPLGIPQTTQQRYSDSVLTYFEWVINFMLDYTARRSKLCLS